MSSVFQYKRNNYVKKIDLGPRHLAEQPGVLAALLEDLSSVPSTHVS